MIDAHAAAVQALLTAAITAPRKVFDGKVDPPVTDVRSTPYALTYYSASFPDLAFTGVTHTFQMRITVHNVGGSTTAARRVADDSRAALLNVTPTVAGRKCYPIRFDEGGDEPLPNEATGSSIVDYVERYTLRSVPSA